MTENTILFICNSLININKYFSFLSLLLLIVKENKNIEILTPSNILSFFVPIYSMNY